MVFLFLIQFFFDIAFKTITFFPFFLLIKVIPYDTLFARFLFLISTVI